MLKKNKSISVNGSSTVVIDSKEIVIMTMSANIREDGGISFNEMIQNMEQYNANKTQADSDREEFRAYALGLAEV